MKKRENIVKKRQKLVGLLWDIMIISIGLMISSFGTSLFYQAGMGSGAMATFSDGLHRLLHISYGTANMAANVVFLVLLFVCDRRMIGVGTVLCVFLIGVFVDMGNVVFSQLPIEAAPAAIRFVCVLAGCVMMGVGLGLYVAVERGFGALEGLVKYLCARTGAGFDKVKIGQDVLLIGLGILLQAEWGVGTLVSAVTIGPIMRLSITRFQALLHRREEGGPQRTGGGTTPSADGAPSRL